MRKNYAIKSYNLNDDAPMGSEEYTRNLKYHSFELYIQDEKKYNNNNKINRTRKKKKERNKQLQIID